MPGVVSNSSIQPLRSAVADTIRRLAERPAVLFAVLLSVNAFAQPYEGFVHDARLYAVQVENRVTSGAFADDLFLRFGSQDQYTPFSVLAAPLAKVLGIEWLFFILYLISNALLVYATMRLVRALIDDEVLGTIALLLTMFSPLPYGGLSIFHVYEPFFTPRLIACAFSALALERTIARRYVGALVLAIIGTVAHPLMGFPALALVTASAAVDMLPRKAVAALAAGITVGTVVVLVVRPLGVGLFGTMDGEWVRIVQGVSAYNFPLMWQPADWLNVVISVALVLAASVAIAPASQSGARLMLLAAALAVFGLAAMVVAGVVPYRFLLQGQPYRALWIVRLLEIPAALALAERAWRRGRTVRLVSVILVLAPFVPTLRPVDAALAVPALVFLTLFHQWRSRPVPEDWLLRSFAGSLAIMLVVDSVISMKVALGLWSELRGIADVVGSVLIVASIVRPLLWLPIVLSALMLMKRRMSVSMIGAGAAILAILVHFSVFAVRQLPAYVASMIPDASDREVVKNYFDRRPTTSQGLLTVYAGAWGNIAAVWVDLGAKSYFDLGQVVGVLFSRETAVEGNRRAQVVRAFELERYHRHEHLMADSDKVMYTGLFHPEPDLPPASRADLARLCLLSEGVDVAILNDDFGQLAAAGNGHVFVYECARVRNHL